MTCECGKTTRDEAYVCDTCLDKLSRTLGDLPNLLEELDTTITRQRSAGQTGDARPSGERPLPWHDKAAEAKRDLHGLLATWARFCDEEQVRHSSPRDGLPADDTNAIGRWLMWRVDGLAFHDLGNQAVTEITDAAESCWRIVFWKPRNRVYLGPCGFGETSIEVGETIECPGDVYLDPEDPHSQSFGKCDFCNRPVNAADRQHEMECALADRLCTAAEIARMAVHLGLEQPREAIRNRVNQWHKRKQITASAHDRDGNPMFRYGDVRILLAGEHARRGA